MVHVVFREEPLEVLALPFRRRGEDDREAVPPARAISFGASGRRSSKETTDSAPSATTSPAGTDGARARSVLAAT